MTSSPLAFLSGGGEAGALIRAHDWAATPLGAPDGWPAPLKTAVALMLAARQPVYVAWGPDLTSLYNDGYLPIVGAKHPGLGQPFATLWAEVWDQFRPIVEATMRGEAQHFVDLPIALGGRPEVPVGFFTFSYTALRDDDGRIAGFYCAATETTQRVRAEDALRLAMEAGRLGTWELDLATGDLTASSICKANFGRPIDAPFTYADLRDAVHPDDRTRMQAAVERSVATGEDYDVEYRLVTQSGEVRWVHIRAQVACGPDGTPLRMAGVSIDVTARARAEAALRVSDARLQGLIDSIDQMVWSTRPDGFHDFYNHRWYQFTGVPEGSTDGEAWNGMFHPDDQERAWATWRHSLETGEPYRIEYRLRHRSGEYRWVLGRAQAVRDAEGRISRWYGTCTDIEEIVEAREVLARSREDLEREVAERTAERNQLWTLSADMLARADYEGMMSAVSPAWTQVLGWSESELLTRPYATFMHPEDAGVTLAALARMGETGQPTRFENRIATATGGWKPIEWTVVPEPDGPNFIAVGRDLSEVKAREAELEAARDALRQSQKMEAMGQLTGGVAHDFNNLLTPIIGSLDRLVSRGVGSERERRLLGGALESAERAKTLVQRLLAFARRQPLQPVPVDLGALVQGMTDLLGSTLGPAIDLRTEVAADLPPAVADANQVEMALLNLVVNSRDAMPGGGRLTIRTSRESVGAPDPSMRRVPPELGRGHYVRLAVADTGAGMTEATLARAMEPFFSTKGIGKGTGLGLSMVHGLAAQLGGALRIESQVGEGTTVELWLPVSGVAEESGPGSLTRDPALGPVVRGRALLVDDEDLVRMSTASMLEDLGFEVSEVASAEAALALLREGAGVDLLVTDHLMPGMTGADLVREARRARPDLPALIVSGYAEAEGIAPDLPRLVKPFRAGELRASVAGLLPGMRQGDVGAS